MLNEVKTIVSLLMKRPITEEIAQEIETTEGFEHLEIENGAWVGFDEDEHMGGEEHGWVESLFVTALTNWVLLHKSGRIYTGDTNFVLEGTADNLILKRRPDIAYVRSAKVKSSKGYIYGAPDLAIEVISPTERPGAVRKKLREYLDHGVQQVWQVFSDSQEIIVHLPDGTSKTYGLGQTILGGDLLPDFMLEVSWIFQREPDDNSD
jgi:Uma2 family endonuclease